MAFYIFTIVIGGHTTQRISISVPTRSRIFGGGGKLLNEEEFKIELKRNLDSARESLAYSAPEVQDMHWEVLYEKLLALYRSMNP